MNLKSSNPPLIKIKKENIKDFTEKFLIPNSKYIGWPVLRKEFECLEYLNSNLFILYKNELPIGQFIETIFNDSICVLSHFVLVQEERHKGYGHMLIEEFYNSHKNRRICCVSADDMFEFYDQKLNLKKIKRCLNCTLDFDRKSLETLLDSKNVRQLNFSANNLTIMNEFLFSNYGYRRDKTSEFYLKNGSVYGCFDNNEINGILLSSRIGDEIRVDNVISSSLENACDLFYCFLKNLPAEKFKIFLTIPQTDKFKEFISTFSIKYDENNFCWITDTNLNCTYDNFYCISNAIL
jgi:hypothetical protein